MNEATQRKLDETRAFLQSEASRDLRLAYTCEEDNTDPACPLVRVAAQYETLGERVQYYKRVTAEQLAEMARTGVFELEQCYAKGLDVGARLPVQMKASLAFLEDFTAMRARFKQADFCAAQFGGECTDFSGAQFDEAAQFAGACLGASTVLFSECHFAQAASFVGAQLLAQIIRFDGAAFEVGTCWTGALLGDVVLECQGAFLGAEADFSKTESSRAPLLRVAGLTGAGGLDFERAKLPHARIELHSFALQGGRVSLDRLCAKTVLFDNVIFACHTFCRVAQVENLIFQDCIIEQTLNLRSAEIKPQIGHLSFHATQNLGHIDLFWGAGNRRALAESNHWDEAGQALVPDTPASRTYQLSLLKENYHAVGKYEDEDKVFVQYMRTRRKTLRHWWQRALDCLIDAVGVYATSPTRVAISMLVVVLGFAVLFGANAVLGGVLTENIRTTELLGGIKDSLRLSAATFLTIDTPRVALRDGWGSWWGVLEGFCGLFLMSYFSVAVVHKTLH